MKKILLILTMFISFSVSAFSVDNMILVANSDGQGLFTLTSTKNSPEYIRGEISQVKVVDGEIEKLKLTKDNLPLWDLAAVPSKLILNPGERRRVAMKNLCQMSCTGLIKDKVYQVEFSPGHVIEKNAESNVGLQVGYAPYFIVPAEESNIEYDIDYNIDSGTVRINNKSNTFIYMQFDYCDKNRLVSGCKKTYTFLSGRIKDVSVPDKFKFNDRILIHVANHDYSYNEDVYVSKN